MSAKVNRRKLRRAVARAYAELQNAHDVHDLIARRKLPGSGRHAAEMRLSRARWSLHWAREFLAAAR